MRPPTWGAAITVAEVLTPRDASTPAEAIITADVSGRALTSVSGSASRLGMATIWAPGAATMTGTATGSRLPVIQTCTPVTDVEWRNARAGPLARSLFAESLRSGRTASAGDLPRRNH